MLTKKVLMYRIMSEGVVSGRKLRDLPDTKKGPLSANGPLFLSDILDEWKILKRLKAQPLCLRQRMR